nr:hypothetical protein [Tanacetum cinerariifolium]
MVNLEFCDTHNMVAYLEKLEGSKGFHQIVDFLNASHIRYALTENPTIYVSLINQFWETATTRTLDNEEIEIIATIDGKVKIATEASIRRHLKLAESDGISSLPTTDIFEYLSLMGCRIGQWYIDQNPTMPHDSPLLRVNTLESNEGSMTLQELMVFCTTLSKKVESLEKDLKQTKKIYGAAYTKLIKKGRKIAASPKVKTVGVFVDDTAAETLVYIKRSEEKVKDKGKGIMKESESPIIKTKRTKLQQEQERLGLEAAMRLQAKIDEEERQRIARRLQIEKREKYSEDEQAKMLVDLINQRKRYFAAQRAEVKRNKPITQAQQRTYTSNYIKHMTNYKLQQLKKLFFDEIKDLFEITMRRVNTFVPIETEVRRGVLELVADSS